MSWAPIRRRPLLAAGAVPIAAALLLGQVVADAGAIAYRRGIDALRERDLTASVAHLTRSVAIDPWHPTGPDALGIVRAEAGDLRGAREALEDAVRLDPGNGRAWANLAVACLALDERGCAADAASEALAFAPRAGATLLNAAAVLDDTGAAEAAAEAYRRALLNDPSAAFVAPAPAVAAVAAVADDPALQLDGEPVPELIRLVIAAAAGSPIDPDDFAANSTRMLAAAIVGDRATERDARARALADETRSLQTWAVVLALDRRDGRDTSAALRAYAAIAGRPAPRPAHELRPPRFTLDIGSFRAIPFDGFPDAADDLRTDPPYPWVLAELVADR